MVRTKANSMARKAAFDRGLGVIEESQMTNILLYILENGGCRKSEIYRDLPRSSRYPEKLARLEEAGLIKGYRPIFNYSVMGLGIKAIILMKSKSNSRVAEKHFFRLLRKAQRQLLYLAGKERKLPFLIGHKLQGLLRMKDLIQLL